MTASAQPRRIARRTTTRARATPDQNVVDELGSALGVPRAPDEEVRTSGEILERRDRYRWEQETGGDA